MQTSKTVRGYMQVFLLTEQEAYMAMLIAAGATQGEAFAVSMSCMGSSVEILDSRASELMRRKKGIKELANRLTDITVVGSTDADALKKSPKKKGKKNLDETNFDPTNKDNIISIRAQQLQNSTSPKEKADIAVKIADLQRMKQDENKEEAKLIHFYVPLTCKRCNLYVAELEKRKEEQKTKNI